MSALDAYVVNEPFRWTNISTLTTTWMASYVRSHEQTEVTVDSPAVTGTLNAFAQVFDYDRSCYALLVLKSDPDLALGVSPQYFQSVASARNVGESQVELKDAESPALGYVEDIVRWLSCTYEELASMTGISRSAIFYWRRTGVSPRQSNVRSLLRLHSLLAMLVRRFEVRGAQAWLNAGEPTPLTLLLDGNLAGVEEAFRRSLMLQSGRPERYARRVDEEQVVLEVKPGSNEPPRRAQRRPKRGPLPSP